MPLSSGDITILSNQIINRFDLSDLPDIESIVQEIVTICDLKLEEKFPTVYVSQVTGTSLKEKEFIKAREYYILCNLFTEWPSFLAEYNQPLNVSEVQNSAGTRVRIQDNKNKQIQASDYCKLAKDIFVSIGVLNSYSQITFKQSNNVLSK